MSIAYHTMIFSRNMGINQPPVVSSLFGGRDMQIYGIELHKKNLSVTSSKAYF